MLFPDRECPQGGIETPSAFPREPETNNNICQILQHSPDALDQEDKGDQAPEGNAAPATVADAVTATAVNPGIGKAEAGVAGNRAAAPPIAAHHANRSRFR